MDRKLKDLIDSARETTLWANTSRRWDKVAEYADDWDEVRNGIHKITWGILPKKDLANFAAACKRYNDKIEKGNARLAEQEAESKTSIKTDIGFIAGAAILGAALGSKHDPNKRIDLFNRKK